MSTVALGANAHMELSLAAAGNFVEVSGMAQGVDNLTRGLSSSPRQVPGGRGINVSTLPKFDTHDFSMSADSNVTHDSIFEEGQCVRVRGRYFPNGKGTGSTVVAFGAVMSTTITFAINDDSVVWQVAFAVDGTPVATTI